LYYPDNIFGTKVDHLSKKLLPMKTLSSITLVLILALWVINSCKKDPIIAPIQDVTGQWQWLSSWYDRPMSDSNPKTPQNTGIQETIEFSSNNTWLKIQNNIHIDSGTYSTGHGSYLPYIGAYNFVYDSIVYFRNGISEKGTQDYYKISNDTLQFSGGFAGISGGGSKFYIRHK
jgi:hypothetical protein